MSKLAPKEEIKLLRSALAGIIGRDKEGRYRPKFIAEIFRDVKRKPTTEFTDEKSFLKDVSHS